MSEQKKPSPAEIDQILRTAARRRRPWSLWAVLLLLLIFGLPLGLFLWWVWPRPTPPHLAVLTSDQLTVPGQAVTLSAQLVPEDSEAEGRLGGWNVFFEELPAQRPGGSAPWLQKAISSANGLAQVDWPAAEPGTMEFAARYVIADQKLAREDRGCVFVWPATAKLLLVDVEGVAAKVPAKAWESAQLASIPREPGTADVLLTAQEKGYKIVYLALTADRPLIYRKMRDWLQQRPPAGEKAFPKGPVLGRLSYYGASETEARKAALEAIQRRFASAVEAKLERRRAEK